METIEIILADDHKLLRDGIKTLISKNTGLKVIAEANDGDELIEIVKNHSPDVIIIDLTMPNKNGIEAISILKKDHPMLKFLVLTMHDEGEYVLKCIENGVNGFLLKNTEYEELIDAIKIVAEGGRYFNNNISDLIIESLSIKGDEKNRQNNILTPREVEILREVANGLSTKLIAEKLFISTRTVETHRLNMTKKLEAHNTAELIKIALENKII